MTSREDRSDTYLVVANAYPSENAIYRNGFIHRRVRGYIDAGEAVEVFYFHPPVNESYTYEFDGVHVTVGNASHFEAIVSSAEYRKFLIHFVTREMVEPIMRHARSTPIITWIHGFEAEAWHRRWFNLVDSPAQIRNALNMRESHFRPQLEFLNWFYQTAELDATFVHVSEWFQKNIAEPDAGVPTRKSVVIPNVIDTQVFPFRSKSAEDRLRVLSIRPYASRKYANDLTAKAILALSERPYFDDFEFTLYGEGALFNELTAPLKGYRNVSLHNTFLPQSEIAAQHMNHGVFLAPTRFDSQGVSMCEAMSSGLVPISTDIAAIPEFVTHRESGMLARAESAVDLADHLEALYFDPDLYLRLSEYASRSIQNQCGEDATIQPELELLRS